MIRNIKFILPLIFLCSCKAKTTDRKPDKQSGAQNFSSLDTLNKYKGTDTLLKGKHLFYIGHADSLTFGLFRISDSTFSVYQQQRQGWLLTDTLPLWDIVSVRYADLNGDDHSDIVITHNYTGAGGNEENVVLLYTPETRRFRHNKTFDLPNIQYDKGKGRVYSAWWASVNHPQTKRIYKITGDSLALFKEVSYTPDEQTGHTAVVEFYFIEVGCTRFTYRTNLGNSDQMLRIFNKAFWDTSDQ